MTTRRLLVLFGALSLGSVAVALVAWRALRRKPPLRPSVMVSVANAASADENESTVLAPLENDVANASHVASIDGRATSSGATLFVTLDREGDPFAATQEIQALVAARLNLLPRDAMPPIVQSYTPPTGVRFYVTGPFPIVTMREAVDERIDLALAKLPGVGLVSSCGGIDPAIVIDMDPDRLAANGLDALAVADAVRADRGAKSAADFRDVRVGGVRVGDVATVSDDGRPPSCVAYGPDGVRVVGTIESQPGAHPRKEVEAEIATQAAFLPAGMHVVRFDFDEARVRAFVQLADPLSGPAKDRLMQSIAKAARVADVEDALVTSPREPRAGLDLEVEATLPHGASRSKIRDARRALERAIAELPGSKILTATDDDPPLVLHVVGADADSIRRAAEAARDALGKSTDVRGVVILGARTSPEIETRVDRAMAARLGISAADVARTIRLATSGERAGTIFTTSSSKPVWIQVHEPLPFDRLRIGHAGTFVPLSAVVTVENRAQPEEIEHWNRERAATIWIEGDRRGSESALKGVSLPPGVRLVWEN